MTADDRLRAHAFRLFAVALAALLLLLTAYLRAGAAPRPAPASAPVGPERAEAQSRILGASAAPRGVLPVAPAAIRVQNTAACRSRNRTSRARPSPPSRAAASTRTA